MNRFKHSVCRMIVFSLLISLLSACGSQTTSTAIPEPKGVELKAAEFDGIVIETSIGDLPVFTGSGSIQNDSGQVLLITVTGPSSTSVTDYFNTALFYFEIRETFDFPATSEPDEELPNLSVEEILKDAEMENLRIEFDLSRETSKDYPKGILFVIVDPTVIQNRYNNYATKNPATNQLAVTIKTSLGKVTARLYRQCAFVASRSVSAGNENTLPGSGAGYFDLTVQGNNANNNTYRLTGAWNFDYTPDLPDAIAPNITC